MMKGDKTSVSSYDNPSKINSSLPDEFVFRQNETRADDLEVEERALMNLAAQELDQIRVLQKLPKDSELYAHKLKQFRELSAMRVEVEKVLQEQRLEKIQRDFEKQKIEEEREFQHQEWLENQKMLILESRMAQSLGMQMQPAQMNKQVVPQMAMPVQPQRPYAAPLRKYSEPLLSDASSENKGLRLISKPSEPKPQPSVSKKGPEPSKIDSRLSQLEEKAKKALDQYDPDVGLVCMVDLVSGLPR